MPIDNQLGVSVGLTLAIVETLRTLRIEEPESLLAAAGIEQQLLERPENRIPLEQQQVLWQLAIERSNSACFGLHFARCIQPTNFGLLGYMAMNCRTIGECFDAIVKYQFLAGQGGEFATGKDAGGAIWLRYTPVNPGHPATFQRVVAMLAATVSFGRWLVGDRFVPQAVEFCGTTTVSCSEREDGIAQDYIEFFACPVRFEQAGNRLVFADKVMDLVVPNASEDLLLLLSERANRLLETLSRRSGIATRIASLLATQLSDTLPDKAVISSQLGMSERTMQRRLREEGTSFQEILDNTRHYLARELLRNTRLPLAAVASRLGFSEPSTFYRAFRKWEGSTPGQYRQANAQAPTAAQSDAV